jgi:hypothetical protein
MNVKEREELSKWYAYWAESSEDKDDLFMMSSKENRPLLQRAKSFPLNGEEYCTGKCRLR